MFNGSSVRLDHIKKIKNDTSGHLRQNRIFLCSQVLRPDIRRMNKVKNCHAEGKATRSIDNFLVNKYKRGRLYNFVVYK